MLRMITVKYNEASLVKLAAETQEIINILPFSTKYVKTDDYNYK